MPIGKSMSDDLTAGQTIIANQEIGGVLSAVAEQIGDALDASLVDLYEYLPEHDALLCEGSWRRSGITSNDRGYVCSITKLSERPFWRRIVEGGEVVELYNDDLNVPQEERAALEEWGILASLGVPLSSGDRVVGMFFVAQTDYVRHFTAADSELLLRLSFLASLAITNARLLRREERLNSRLASLLDASRFIAASLDVTDLTDRVESELRRVYGTPLERGVIRLRTEDGRYVSACEWQDAQEGNALTDADSHVDSVIESALRLRKPVQSAVSGNRERLVLPLESRSRVIGYIELVGSTNGHFYPADVELVQILANQAAVAVENAALYSEMRRQARTDPLTGLYNRRYFLERFSREVASAMRTRCHVGLLMVDVDRFKQYNDTYGHQEGDAALARIAETMRLQLREGTDFVCRYGGEEFVVLLSDVEAKRNKSGNTPNVKQAVANCRNIAERLRVAVESLEHRAQLSGPPQTLTVSIGGAAMRSPDLCVSELLRRADQALYGAKAEGRNRVVVLSEDDLREPVR